MCNKEEEQLAPPRIEPRIRSAPKVRQVYWCEYPRDAILPEMWKIRPVIIVSHRAKLRGPCLVLPISTAISNEGGEWTYKLQRLDGFAGNWAICNHVTTVSTSRLSQIDGKIPRLDQEEFNAILDLIGAWIPAPIRG